MYIHAYYCYHRLYSDGSIWNVTRYLFYRTWKFHCSFRAIMERVQMLSSVRGGEERGKFVFKEKHKSENRFRFLFTTESFSSLCASVKTPELQRNFFLSERIAWALKSVKSKRNNRKLLIIHIPKLVVAFQMKWKP